MSKATELELYLLNLPIGSWEEHTKNKEAAALLRSQETVIKQCLEALEDSQRLTCTMVGNSLMHEPSMFERNEVCKYVRGWFRRNKVSAVEKVIAAAKEVLK